MRSTPELTQPTGVDPSLIQGARPSQEEAKHLIDEFWANDPTEIWQPYTEAVLGSIAAGNTVTMLSGAHGSGKTMQLRHGLSRKISVRQIHEATSNLNRSITEGRVKEDVIAIDEVAPLDQTHLDKIAGIIKAGVDQGKQFLLVTPNRNSAVRKKMIDLTTEELAKQDIEVEYIGDVSNVHITTDRATDLLQKLSAEPDAIRIIEQTSALRSPRLFSRIVDSHYYGGYGGNHETVLTMESLNELIEALVNSSGAVETRESRWATTISELATMDFTQPIPPHAIFMSDCISTADCVSLYEALGKPLPTASDFPNQQLFELAYSKD